MLFKWILVVPEGENTTKGKVIHKLFTVGLKVTANEGLNQRESNKPEKAGKGIFTGALFVKTRRRNNPKFH